MKKILLLGLLVSGVVWADDGVQVQIDDISKLVQAKQDSMDRLSNGLTITRNYRETDEERAAIEKERAALAKKPNARIGMSAKQVKNNTNWGEPDKINETLNSSGSFQQWVYGDEYLYFQNGKLVSIQTSR